jgi:hypothetical protein
MENRELMNMWIAEKLAEQERNKNLVTKIDITLFTIEIGNERIVDYGNNCNYEQFVEILKKLKKDGKIAKDCKVVI